VDGIGTVSTDAEVLSIASTSYGLSPRREEEAVSHSLVWDELPLIVRQWLVAAGIGPGDRIYLCKLRALTDSLLDSRFRECLARGQDADAAVRTIGRLFGRQPKTIRRRLQRCSVGGSVAQVEAGA